LNLLNTAKNVIDIEIQGLVTLKENLGDEINEIVDVLLATKGKAIICGMGKSGIIGKKIAASLSSTGTPSFFMHPGEAFHGDLGMVQPEDVFVAISNSGETDEVLKLLPFLKDNENVVVGITGNPASTLAQNSDFHLNVAVPEEACPLQLAPTSSTTATLVIGDVLTVALMEARKFQPENFARFHPGGSLGKRLLSKVKDEMVSKNLPFVAVDDSFSILINEMTKGQLGLAIVKKGTSVVGLVTDGDLRRAMEKYEDQIFSKEVADFCSYSPHLISPNASMQAALDMMSDNNINCLLVDDGNDVVGVLKK